MTAVESGLEERTWARRSRSAWQHVRTFNKLEIRRGKFKDGGLSLNLGGSNSNALNLATGLGWGLECGAIKRRWRGLGLGGVWVMVVG